MRIKQSKQAREKQRNPSPKLIFSTYETAKIIGIGHNAVRDLVYSGVLKTLPGRNIRIPIQQIDHYIAENTAQWNKK